MDRIETGGGVFSVDRERTRRYYTANEVCDCTYCQLFQRRVRAAYPELAAYLERFGVELDRPDETGPIELEDRILYFFAGYTVCGSILQPPAEETVTAGGKPLRIEFEEGFQFPNNQEGEYFSITVCDLALPKDGEE